MKTLMKNCHVVSPGFQEDELYDIYVVDGMIEEVGKNLENEAAKIMDIGGNF
mgnify:CR=1 FL=1